MDKIINFMYVLINLIRKLIELVKLILCFLLILIIEEALRLTKKITALLLRTKD